MKKTYSFLIYPFCILQVTQWVVMVFLLSFDTVAQTPNDDCEARIMFYNVENLFDTIDSKDTHDSEFTPAGSKKWNTGKYYEKLNNLYKVIACEGGWDFPVLIGLSEIENDDVIKGLIYGTPLSKFDYLFVHEDSPDERGIDVALIYQKNLFQLLSHHSIVVELPENDHTRDILFVEGKMRDLPVSIFVNHWPSRYGGKMRSEPDRQIAANTLISSVEKHSDTASHSNIILMGDFNDTPVDASLQEIFRHKFKDADGQAFSFINIMPKEGGTITYKDINYDWYPFDQIIVTDRLMQNNHYTIANQEVSIIKKAWMLNEYGRPKRTFLGSFHQGGYSDHLPVMLKLLCH